MKSVLVRALLGLSLVGVFSLNATAREFKKKHPRRSEVVGRANNEENKNNAATADGKITGKQAAKLDRQDEAIKRQEERQARRNGGHITKKEQARDNREENRVNAERNQMEKRDAAAGEAAPAQAQ
jgi:hypothetical protein